MRQAAEFSSQLGAGRLRRSVLICAAGWSVFMVESLVRGNPVSAGLTVAVTVLTTMLWLVSRGTSDERRLVNIVRTNILVSYMGLFAAALTHGYTAAPAAWFVALTPLFAAYHLPPRDTSTCAAVSATFVLLICYLEPLQPLSTEMVYQGWELALPQLLNVALVLAFALNASRTHERQLQIISGQSRVVEAARDEALEAAHVKTRFLANMSHEIRTPLNGMLGLATLLDQSRLDDDQRHWVNVMRGSGRLLVAILNDILDYSKLESGSMLLERIEFDLEDVMMDVLELFYSDARQKGVELVALIEPGVARVWCGDPLRLGQVLLNLVSNGVKFTSAGRVVVRVAPGRRHGVRFTVSDTGLGIEAEKLDRLFRPFHQVDSSITRQYGGTGLGLAISQRLATMMGGPIEASSEPGRGSEFCFELPLKDVASPPVQLDVAVSTVGFSELENESFRGIADRLGLRSTGAEVTFLQLEEPLSELPAGKLVLVTQPEQQALRDWARSQPFAARLLRPLRTRQVEQALCSVERGVAEVVAVEPALVGLRVLITEDNAVNRKVLATMLESTGATVRLAETGAEAVKLASSERFDVILMDLQMPVMDGIEATRLIRARAGHQPRILAITADVLPEARAAVLEVGADGFLTKPIDRDRLLAELSASQRDAEHGAGDDAGGSE